MTKTGGEVEMHPVAAYLDTSMMARRDALAVLPPGNP